MGAEQKTYFQVDISKCIRETQQCFRNNDKMVAQENNRRGYRVAARVELVGILNLKKKKQLQVAEMQTEVGGKTAASAL